MYDIVLNNGLVIEPASAIMSRLNVGIRDGKVARLTREKIRGCMNYDCTGMIVSPGFVDIHMHEDPQSGSTQELQTDISQCMLRMGVTTVVGGNCGEGPKNQEEYLNRLNCEGNPVNIALLSAHESLRANFGVFSRYESVSGDIVGKMCGLLEKELQNGSFGLSFGIRYVPGLDLREMLPLCEIVRKYNGIVAAHIRDDADGVIKSVDEVVQLARLTGVRLQISHVGSMAAFGYMEAVYSYLDECVAEGLDLGVDCYPYNAYCTSIGSTTFDEGFLQRYGCSYEALELTQGAYHGQRCTRGIFDHERANHPEYLVVGHLMRGEEVDQALSHPRTLVASDGVLNEGNGHPRAAGTFPRFIRQYVVDKQKISLFEAICRVSYLPAKRVGLPKGTLSPGSDADLVVFDLQTIRDRATYEDPKLPPEGIHYVFVGGKPAVEKGVIVNNKLGRAVKKML